MSGLFPLNAPAHPWLPTTAGPRPATFKITGGDATTNWATRLNEGNCARYDGAVKDVAASQAYKDYNTIIHHIKDARVSYYNKYRTIFATTT